MARQTFTENDHRYMAKAVELAWRAKGRTFPNPAVGAVVVKKGAIIANGATAVCGGLHAEASALLRAGARARGATLYVTLEPCCHHGRTPPCTDAIKASGITRVVAATKDPNPLVAGKGFAQLRRHGIEIQTGLLKKEASAVNEDFFWSVTRRRAWVSLKLAMTLDGRIADDRGGSRWITSAQSRRFVHELRRCHAAIAVGRTTLECDDPKLTVRHKAGFAPARIVFAPDHHLPASSYFATHTSEARSIVVVRGGKLRSIESRDSGIEFWHTGTTDRNESLVSFLEMAFEQGLSSVLVEGGQRLASPFLEYGLVNRMYLFYGNRILGKGQEGILFQHGLPISACIRLSHAETKLIGPDVLISGIPERSVAPEAIRLIYDGR